MNKKGFEISLHMLLGLLVTVLLILAFINGISSFLRVLSPQYERDIVRSWVDEIRDLDDGIVTELLPLDKVRRNYFIAVFQAQTESMAFRLNNQNFIFDRPASCGLNSCVCTYNVDSNNFQFCLRLRHPRASVQTTPQDTFNTYDYNQRNGIAFFNEKYWRRDNHRYEDVLIASQRIFVETKGDRVNFRLESSRSADGGWG